MVWSGTGWNFFLTPEQLCRLENVTTPSIDSETVILDILSLNLEIVFSIMTQIELFS